MNPNYGSNAHIALEIGYAIAGLIALGVVATIVAWAACKIRRTDPIDAHNALADKIDQMPRQKRYTRGGRPRMIQVFGPDAADRRERSLAGRDADIVNRQVFK